jgi:hypothetical protein
MQVSNREAALMEHKPRRHRLRASTDIPLGMLPRRLPWVLRQVVLRHVRCRIPSPFCGRTIRHKVSNGQLWVITYTVCEYASRVQEVDADAYVDKIINPMATQAHKACSGPEGGCPVCLTVLERATLKMKFLDKMMQDCGLEYSDKGDMTIRQGHLFIGIIFDVLHGKLLIAKEKFDKTTKPLRCDAPSGNLAKGDGQVTRKVRTPTSLH